MWFFFFPSFRIPRLQVKEKALGRYPIPEPTGKKERTKKEKWTTSTSTSISTIKSIITLLPYLSCSLQLTTLQFARLVLTSLAAWLTKCCVPFRIWNRFCSYPSEPRLQVARLLLLTRNGTWSSFLLFHLISYYHTYWIIRTLKGPNLEPTWQLKEPIQSHKAPNSVTQYISYHIPPRNVPVPWCISWIAILLYTLHTLASPYPTWHKYSSEMTSPPL